MGEKASNIERAYIVKVSASEKNLRGERQNLPTDSVVRGVVEVGLSDFDNLRVTVTEAVKDKDARIVELEENLHALLNHCMEDCRTKEVTKAYWQAVRTARECMNKSAWENLHMEAMPMLNSIESDGEEPRPIEN